MPDEPLMLHGRLNLLAIYLERHLMTTSRVQGEALTGTRRAFVLTLE